MSNGAASLDDYKKQAWEHDGDKSVLTRTQHWEVVFSCYI